MPELPLPLGTLHFHESEDPHPDQGAPLIFIHGAGASGGVWLYQLRALRHNRLGIALDLPGHGLSPDFSSHTSPALSQTELLDLYVDALIAFLDGLKFGKYILVGHALGASIALCAALKRPDLCDRLCLVASSLTMPPHHLVTQTLQGPLPSWTRMMQDLLYSPSTPRRFVEKAVESGFQASAPVLQRDFDLWMQTNLRDADLSRLPNALLICGADDAMVPVPLSEALMLRLPSARVEVIEEAGHMVMIERHKRFNAVLQSLLDPTA